MHETLADTLRKTLEQRGETSFLARHEFYLRTRAAQRDAAEHADDPQASARALELLEAAIETVENEMLRRDRAEERTSETSKGRLTAPFRYVLLGLLAIGVVAAAAWGATQLDFGQSGTPEAVIGADPPATEEPAAQFDPATRIQSTAGQTVTPSADGAYVTLVSEQTGQLSNGVTDGARIAIATEIEQALAGRTIRVVIRARASAQNGAPALNAAYSTAAVGNSGWRALTLTSEFSDLAFTYSVPEGGQPGTDYLGLSANVEGGRNAADIEAITIYLVNE